MKKHILVSLVAILTIAMFLPTTSFATTTEQEEPKSNQNSIEFTEEELQIIENSKETPIRVGVIDNSAPVSYWNENRQAYEGIIIDMLNLVSEKTGLCVTYMGVDMSRRSEAKKPKEDSPQIVVGITFCPNLPDFRGWVLSDMLYSDSLTVVSSRGTDLSQKQVSKRVAIMEELGMSEEFVKLHMPEYNIITYPTLNDCLDAVVKGEADAAIYLRSCISYFLQKPRYENLEIIPSYSEEIYSCVAGFTKNSVPLVNIVNKGLEDIPIDVSRDIAFNYTLMNPYQLSLSDIIYDYRFAIILIILLVLAVVAALFALAVVRKRSAKKVKEALVIAEKASEAKGNFMSRMSHEIRTPLNAIIGYNTIAKNEINEAKSDSERRQAEMRVMDCLTKNDIASRHLLTIINDVLNMAAIESGKIKIINERFDFKGLISSLTAVFYSQAKAKGVHFEVRFISQMEEWLIGDQLRVNQVLTNLLSNAIKFTHDGGEVILYIQPETKDKEIEVRFRIKDTGIGMTEEYLEHIWTPFEQADSSIARRFGGTGLGLAITKNLVDLMNGTIDVISKSGEGTTFDVNISFSRTEQPQKGGLYDFSKVKALVVDDDISTCDYIRLLLTRSGVRSVAVTSGDDAVFAVNDAIEKKDPYTLCLVDWYMPELDGIKTIKRIREMPNVDMPMIVITAYDYSEISEQAAGLGISMFISKPLFQSTVFNLLANITGCSYENTAEKAKRYNFAGVRILLAEDNVMNMEIADHILETAGFVVDQAKNGEEAVNMFESAPEGTYQAILMDVQMPVMDGYQATSKIRSSTRAEGKTIPIIAMTADAFAENIAESIASGMNVHISKPIDVNTLFETLTKCLEKDA